MGRISAQEAAKYFLRICPDEVGDNMTNLKLQKLLYYAQGFWLALYDEPLFDERIEAWQHGPVVPHVYLEYQQFGTNAIPMPENFDSTKLKPDIRKHLDEVFDVFGQFSAWKLRNLTHEEPPWKDTDLNTEISHEKLKEYFATQLIE